MALFLPAIAFALAAQARGTQQFADLGDLRLENGRILKECRLGYRTFGRLNKDRSNAVLICTWFLGNSGNWIDNVGPGRLVDDSKYFVVVADALGNGVSSSPSNSQSQPGKLFPAITIGDMVASQRKLLTEKLGIDHLHAVTGISMGGIQTFSWLLKYPDFMDCAVPIVGSPKPNGADLMVLEAMDRQLQTADHGASREFALKAAADIFVQVLQTPAFFAKNVAPDQVPGHLNGFENALLAWDINDVEADLQALITNDAFKNYNDDPHVAAAAVKAKVLIVTSRYDHAVNPLPAQAFGEMIHADILELIGDAGHSEPGAEAKLVNGRVAKFLEKSGA